MERRDIKKVAPSGILIVTTSTGLHGLRSAGIGWAWLMWTEHHWRVWYIALIVTAQSVLQSLWGNQVAIIQVWISRIDRARITKVALVWSKRTRWGRSTGAFRAVCMVLGWVWDVVIILVILLHLSCTELWIDFMLLLIGWIVNCWIITITWKRNTRATKKMAPINAVGSSHWNRPPVPQSALVAQGEAVFYH